MRGFDRHDFRLWRRLCIFFVVAGLLATGLLPPCRSAAETGEAPVDVVLVIDNSGSMRKNDPEFLTPKTVSEFLDRLSDATRVGMVLFDQHARLLQPLTQLSDPKARQQLSSSLKKVDYRGKFTDSAAGIERAAYELKNDGRQQACKSIIFLTDGIVDTGDRQKDAELTQWLKTDLTAECNTAGIRILGIAFTDNADFPLIQALASRTGGAYYRATHPEDIAGVLDRIQALLPPELPALPVEPAVPEVTTASSETPPSSTEKPPAESSNHPDKGTNGSRSFWKFYLPLILIIFVLMGLVAMLAFKLFSLPSWLGGRKNGPASLPGMRVLPPPEWELQDLTNIGGIHRFDKPRVTVGRDEENDLTLATPTVSNLHATIEYREGAFFLEDQRSTNGTRLNDHQMVANRPVRLKSGDRIGFANLVFKFVRLDQIVSGDTVMLEITPFDVSADESSEPRLGEIDLEKMLQRCLERHLEQIRKLGKKYDEFVYAFFSEKMSDAIAVKAREGMDRTLLDKSQHCSPLIKGNAFYVVCTLPVSASDAVDWFGSEYGGFTRFISKWIKSDGYDVTACDQFCVITFGMEGRPWVSMTVVPTHDDPDPVEIMSVNFLSDAEKAELGLEFDNHGRVL